MVKILFVICLLLFGCNSTRNHQVYESFPVDKERRKSLDDDFNRYLNYFKDLDSSRDGYYLVYNLYLDAIDPDAFLLFYGGNDSVTICPFHVKSAACKEYQFDRKDFFDKSLNSAEPLYPKGFRPGTSKRIYGYKKVENERTYYSLYQMEVCLEVKSCKDNWNTFVQESAEQYTINKKIFNRFDYIVTSLYEVYALNETLQSGMISEDVYEKFKRDLLEKQSNLEREYSELQEKYPNVE